MTGPMANQQPDTSPPVGRVARTANRPGQVGIRTCVGCRGEAGKRVLIRVVRRVGGGAAVDVTGHAAGRGAYLHDDPACIEAARKRRALDRSLHTTIQPELWSELIK
jgi:predicted RNA-binding protein YlxR (DUF448 family)